MEEKNNIVALCGTLAGRADFSHKSRNESYYIFPLDIERRSGAVDTVNVVVREEMMHELEVTEQGKISVSGEIRSYNNKSGQGTRLVITVFAKEIAFSDEEDANDVTLIGTICKKPNLRQTPMGRQICDIMLAVNRRYGRSDYLPCIAWGQTAAQAAALEVGDTIRLSGRIQSRTYIKTEDNVQTERVAFEISIVSIEE